jgi:hypothetical protein
MLIDDSGNARRWRQEAVNVHVSTLQLIRSIPDEAENPIPRQLVDSLRDMVGRLADEERRAGAPA